VLPRMGARSACEATEGKVVAIDGKKLRRSYKGSASDKAPLHMVEAWASEQHLTLGQVSTDDKSNEITAIPELLEALEVAGCLVTCDAIGCQKEIAEAITDQGADYVLALKGNQGELHADAVALFERLDKRLDASENSHKSVSGGHGRVEIRRCAAVEIAGRGIALGHRGVGRALHRLPRRVRAPYRKPVRRRDRKGNAPVYQQSRGRCGAAFGGDPHALARRKQAALGARRGFR